VILPVVVVYAATRTFWWVTTQPWFWSAPIWLDGAVKVGLWVPPSLLMVYLLRGGTWRDALSELGLTRAAWPGTRLALAATLPMAAMLATAPGIRVNMGSLVSAAVLGPLAEEVLYRGFLFQQLWHRARWPVWAAALGSALVFALAHHKDLDETLVLGVLRNDLTTPLAVLLPPTLATVAGGCLFAWITWRWRSLWPAIALHGAINFWWDLAPQGAGSVIAGSTQGVALALMVLLTWRLTSPRGIRGGVRTSDREAASPPASRSAR
jgi:membrane protease YdiL (CAAX protease family)